MLECLDCEDTVNENYTLHTGELHVCMQGENVVRDLGNVSGLDFTYSPETIDHFRGADGSLDAVIPLRKNYGMTMTLDELTPATFALLVGGTQETNLPSGCLIPFLGVSGDCSLSTGAIEFLHTFPCGTKTLAITLWKAFIAATETTLSFGEDILSMQISARALRCSAKPFAPYGQALFTQSCVNS